MSTPARSRRVSNPVQLPLSQGSSHLKYSRSSLSTHSSRPQSIRWPRGCEGGRGGHRAAGPVLGLEVSSTLYPHTERAPPSLTHPSSYHIPPLTGRVPLSLHLLHIGRVPHPSCSFSPPTPTLGRYPSTPTPSPIPSSTPHQEGTPQSHHPPHSSASVSLRLVLRTKENCFRSKTSL